MRGLLPAFSRRAVADLDQARKGQGETQKIGWQWQHFTQKDDKYADQFLGWIGPVKPEFFADKLVVEAVGGKAVIRSSPRMGAREVIGVDLSAAVESAFAANPWTGKCHIIQADIYSLPLRLSRLWVSVGVLHHLPDPRGARLPCFEGPPRAISPRGFRCRE